MDTKDMNVFGNEIEEEEYIYEKTNDDKIFYRRTPDSRVYWLFNPGVIGELMITFDKEHIYNLWTDYPAKLSSEELAIFKEEEPYWANFFSPKTDEPNSDNK